MNTGRAEESVFRLPCHKIAFRIGSKILLTQYYYSQGLLVPAMSRVDFLLCITVMSPDWWHRFARTLYLGSLITIEGFVNLTLVFVCTYSHL